MNTCSSHSITEVVKNVTKDTLKSHSPGSILAAFWNTSVDKLERSSFGPICKILRNHQTSCQKCAAIIFKESFIFYRPSIIQMTYLSIWYHICKGFSLYAFSETVKAVFGVAVWCWLLWNVKNCSVLCVLLFLGVRCKSYVISRTHLVGDQVLLKSRDKSHII